MDNLPLDIVKYLLPFDKRFVLRKGKLININRISKQDERYEILSKIPMKEYYVEDDLTCVYLSINNDKDFYLTYQNYEIQIQTFLYNYSLNHVMQIDAYSHPLL